MTEPNPMPLLMKKLVAFGLILIGAVVTAASYASGPGWGVAGGLLLFALGIALLVAQIVLRNRFAEILNKFRRRRSATASHDNADR